MEAYLPYIWLGVILVMLAVEAATVSMTSSWFALGALCALIVSSFAPWPVQLFVFVLVSAVSLWLLRPVVQRYITAKRTPTNSDRVLGQVGIVLEAIDNVGGVGAVQIGGRTWTARSYTGQPIEKDTRVRILFIEGVKVIVEPVTDPAPAIQE